MSLLLPRRDGAAVRLPDAWYDPALGPPNPLRYHDQQGRMWRTRARFVAAACGRGSGKTLLARRRVVRFLPVKRPWPDPIYFYALPTREQARRVAWDKLKALVPPDWVAETRESDLTIETRFGSKLYLVGADKPERLEGVQWDGGVIDESCDQDPGLFDRSVLPATEHRRAWVWRIGVPKRQGRGASNFRKCVDDWRSGKLGPEYESYTWPSSTVLTPDQIEAARQRMDSKDFDEQYGALWQDQGGLVFHAFDERLNVDASIRRDPGQPIVVGSDFNVDPMSWVIGQKVPGEPRLKFFDEIWMRNTNTRAALDELHRRYGDNTAGWYFFGDASGRARKTAAASSDYVQIVNDSRFADAHVHYPRANPAVADRFSACNAHLCNAAGDRRSTFHPRGCAHLIEDLKTRAYEEGSRAPDDFDDVGHATDAWGYVVHYLYPVVPTSDGAANVLVGR